MSYILFKIGDKNVAMSDSTSAFQVEPTFINKVTPFSNPHHELIDGFINYKGRVVNVIDIAPLVGEERLKKFDGLIFIYGENWAYAIKYEGFFKRVHNARDAKIVSPDDISADVLL